MRFLSALRQFLVPALVAFGLTSPVTHAGLIEVSVEGTIDRVVAGDRSVGERISGTIVFDSETPLTSFFGSNSFNLNFNGAIISFVLADKKIDTVTFNILSRTFSFSGDHESMGFGYAGFDLATGLRENLDLDLRGTDIFDDPFVLSEDIDLAGATSATFGYTRQQVSNPGSFIDERFYGIVTSLSARAVSVPTTNTIWLIGPLATLITLFPRRKKASVFKSVRPH